MNEPSSRPDAKTGEPADIETPPVPDPDTSPTPKVGRHGFPEDTPLAEMSTEQLVAYWKHQSRKHEANAKALKDSVTAEDAQKLRDRISELESAQLTDEQRAHSEALEAAKAEAAAAARDELLPQLRAAEMRGYASIVLAGAKLDGWLDTVNATAFLDSDGHVDGDKVVKHLTDMYGDKPSGVANAQRPNFGQGSTSQVKSKRGEGGRAEAARRFGSEQTP
ncbi:hypothetical protein [Nocardia sp. NPDC050435]|uniref:hypothetical protein n=1 Tax=Nocardia sp. NPDC050435 TaxID=3155040 RepID=UPI0033D6377F